MIDRSRIGIGIGIGIGQKILGGLIVINLIVIAGSILFITQSTVERVEFLTSQDRPSRSFSLAERETLVYLMALDQWSFGLTERRDVQIARGLLAQRLSVIDQDSISPGALAGPEYLSALKESDAILESTVSGLLPAELQKSVQVRIEPVTDQMIVESRSFVDAFQLQEESKVQAYINSVRVLQVTILSSLFLFLVLFSVLVVRNIRFMRSNFRENEEIIQSETDKLNFAIEKLSLSETTVINLEELSETKSAFIENMNHELRTPLASIIGYVEMIGNKTANKPELGISKSLEVVDRNANILLTLVDSIFSLAKLDSHLTPLPNISVDIAQVVDDCILVLQPECEKSNIDINFSIDREVGYFVQGDVEQLNRAVVNLLSNSIKFSEVNSHIEIEVDELNHGENFDVVRIVVRDYGLGIPARDIGKLFTRFYRGKNAMEKQFPGTGLGLAIVEQIVQFHGGTIRIESVEGEGTTVILELPKRLSPADELVLNRRHAVLVRTITDLEKASKLDLYQVTHSLSGLIGFYTFEKESRLIRDFSNWLNSGGVIDSTEVEIRRQSILAILKLRLASLPQRDANE